MLLILILQNASKLPNMLFVAWKSAQKKTTLHESRTLHCRQINLLQLWQQNPLQANINTANNTTLCGCSNGDYAKSLSSLELDSNSEKSSRWTELEGGSYLLNNARTWPTMEEHSGSTTSSIYPLQLYYTTLSGDSMQASTSTFFFVLLHIFKMNTSYSCRRYSTRRYT